MPHVETNRSFLKNTNTKTVTNNATKTNVTFV